MKHNMIFAENEFAITNQEYTQKTTNKFFGLVLMMVITSIAITVAVSDLVVVGALIFSVSALLYFYIFIGLDTLVRSHVSYRKVTLILFMMVALGSAFAFTNTLSTTSKSTIKVDKYANKWQDKKGYLLKFKIHLFSQINAIAKAEQEAVEDKQVITYKEGEELLNNLSFNFNSDSPESKDEVISSSIAIYLGAYLLAIFLAYFACILTTSIDVEVKKRHLANVEYFKNLQIEEETTYQEQTKAKAETEKAKEEAEKLAKAEEADKLAKEKRYIQEIENVGRQLKGSYPMFLIYFGIDETIRSRGLFEFLHYAKSTSVPVEKIEAKEVCGCEDVRNWKLRKAFNGAKKIFLNSKIELDELDKENILDLNERMKKLSV